MSFSRLFFAVIFYTTVHDPKQFGTIWKMDYLWSFWDYFSFWKIFHPCQLMSHCLFYFACPFEEKLRSWDKIVTVTPGLLRLGLLRFAIFCQIFKKIRLKALLNRKFSRTVTLFWKEIKFRNYTICSSFVLFVRNWMKIKKSEKGVTILEGVTIWGVTIWGVTIWGVQFEVMYCILIMLIKRNIVY